MEDAQERGQSWAKNLQALELEGQSVPEKKRRLAQPLMAAVGISGALSKLLGKQLGMCRG